MRALIQRVTSAQVRINGAVVGRIGKGYLVLLGVKEGDSEKEAELLAEKTAGLRVMSDSNGKMNLALKDAGGDVLVVSQFTLCADLSEGRRPSFIRAAKPEIAKKLYEYYIYLLKKYSLKVETGTFGAYMEVELVNDGPVTIMADTDELKAGKSE